jgi:hypothetical protein
MTVLTATVSENSLNFVIFLQQNNVITGVNVFSFNCYGFEKIIQLISNSCDS